MSSHSQRVLVLTNDDGVDAPGMHALRQAAAALGRCRVIAPCGPMSGCGHQVTTHAPIVISPRGPDTLAIAGTPADCIRLAVHSLATDLSWVISGINPGGNLGVDVHHSGTVAAVREAAIHGVPGIAVSHYIARGRAIDWDRAALWTSRVLETLMARPHEPGTFWNVNLPHPGPDAPAPAIIDCPLDPSPLPLEYRLEGHAAFYAGDYQRRPRRPGSDVAVCFGGQISVTLMRPSDRCGSLVQDIDRASRGDEGEKPNP